MAKKCNNNLLSIYVLVKRNIKIYMKDKITVLFSLMAPVIVLLLYVLFLGKLQVENIFSMLGEYNLDGSLTMADIQHFVDNWMISGVMGVSCVTVAVNANVIMVRDRAHGTINDALSSPVKRWVIYVSYIISCFLITLGICLVVLLISIIYLACTGGLMMSFLDFLAILGIAILSCLCSAFLIVLIFGFVKGEAAMSAINGVFSTLVGFIIGAYLPFSMLPTPIQYVACFVPGTYSAGLFRNYFFKGMLGTLKAKIPADVIDELLGSYSIELKFFGNTVSAAWMVLALVVFILIFAAILWILYSNKKTNFFAMGHKKIKKQKAKK